MFRAAAGECRRVFGEIQQQAPGEISMIRRLPFGVVAGIAPFNFPLLLALKKVVYALAAGNTFVLKPASATPVSGVMIAKALDAAGLPAGVFNLVPGSGEAVGNRLVEDPRIKMVAFTGSTAVGKGIAAKASVLFKKYSLEMGGKNPLILLRDFDLDQAVRIAGFGAFFHQGQICMCTSRLIVEEPVYDEFCEKFTAYAGTMKVGDPHAMDTVIGPLIKKEQCDIIDSQIADAVSKGAVLLTGGTHEGNYYQPTVLKDVTPDMRIFYEESFGPVTSIIKAIVRAEYSNPATHGAAIVNEVLNDEELYAVWEDEVTGMRTRIRSMRESLVAAGEAVGADLSFAVRQAGMFSFTGLNAEQMLALREKYGVYGVANGRICIAGLNTENVTYVAKAIAGVR